MLKTQRLLLRPVEAADLDAFARLLADEETTRYFLVPGARSRTQAEVALGRYLAQAAGGAPICMHGIVRDGEILGFAGFVPRRLEWGEEVELGWFLLPEHRGRGYATEAARALRPLRPDRVISLIHPENAPSIAVATRLGMERERDVEILGGPVSVFVSAGAAGQATNGPAR